MTRWWDPGVPVDLLTPGGDPALDAANLLIALHRRGAAALQAAAAIPLCDAATVADALDMTAAATGVEIAKTDLADPTAAANTAAAMLYQACVNKGVIPPVAATRVAKVYGVPAGMLGRYPALAVEPRSSDLVLTDTADRVLFGWVAAATADTGTAIAKAVETPDDRRAAQADQPRARGRYADRPTAEAPPAIGGKSIPQWLAEQLSTPEEAPPAPAPTPAKVRDKITSIRRISRIQPAGATPTRKAPTRKAPALRRPGTREVLGRTARKLLIEARDNAARVNRPVPNPLAGYEPMANAESITTPGVLVLVMDEWDQFRAAMPRGANRRDRVFPLGAINEYVHFSPTARVDVVGSDSHGESIAYVADQVAAQPNRVGLPDARVWELTAEEQDELDTAIRNNHRGERDRLIERFEAKRIREVQDELGLDDRDLSVQRELGHIDWYLDAADEDTVLLVWRPPLEWGDYTTHRPTTVLAEVVVESGYGQVDAGSRHGATTNLYDPTTVVTNADDPDPVMFYDRQRNVALYRTTAQRVDRDDAGTAMSAAERDRLANLVPGVETKFKKPRPGDDESKFKKRDVAKAETPDDRRAAQADQPRAAGRYAARATDVATTPTVDGVSIKEWLADQLAEPAAPAPEQPPPPPARKPISRIRQINRIQPAAGQPTLRPVELRAPALRPAELRQVALRYAESHRDTEPGRGELALHDATDYHLASTDLFQAETGVGKDPTEMYVELPHKGRAWLDTRDVLSGEDVAVELYHRVMVAKDRREGDYWHDPIYAHLFDVSGTDEYGNQIGHEQAIEALTATLHEMFRGNPDRVVLEIELKRVFMGGAEHVHVAVRSNARPLPTETLVRRGDIEPSAPMLLTWEGKRRTMNRKWIRNEIRGYWPQIDATLPSPMSKATTFYMVNPWVETWLAHSPDEYLRDI